MSPNHRSSQWKAINHPARYCHNILMHQTHLRHGHFCQAEEPRNCLFYVIHPAVLQKNLRSSSNTDVKKSLLEVMMKKYEFQASMVHRAREAEAGVLPWVPWLACLKKEKKVWVKDFHFIAWGQAADLPSLQCLLLCEPRVYTKHWAKWLTSNSLP